MLLQRVSEHFVFLYITGIILSVLRKTGVQQQLHHDGTGFVYNQKPLIALRAANINDLTLARWDKKDSEGMQSRKKMVRKK